MCDEKKSITVPTNCIGKIIGKGGQNIRALESDTRTKIQITKDKSGSDTEVILIGTSDQISDVEERIRRLTLSGRSSRSFTNTSWTRPSNAKEEVVQSNEQVEQDYSWDDDEQPQQQYSQPNHVQPQQQYYVQPQQSYVQPPQEYSQPQQDYSQPQQGYFQPQQSYSQNNGQEYGRSFREQSHNNERSQYNDRSQRGFSHNSDRSYRGNYENNDRSYRGNSQNNGRSQRGFSHNNDRSYGGGNSHNNEWSNQETRSQPEYTSNNTVSQPENTEFDMKALNDEYEQSQLKYWSTFPPVKKVFYEELAEVANMTPEEVSIYRKSLNDLVVDRPLDDGTNKPIPNPVSSFAQAFHNYPEILEEIKKVGFVKPSPIQCQAWPVIMGGDDMIGIAQTGTGKTLAFLLPALIHIDSQQLKPEFEGKPSALVLAPTRELALQIHKEVNKYSYRNIKSLCIYGGADRRAQIAELKQGADIIIATPGRLDDLVLAKHIDPEVITYVVLDEADRMLDMGFEPQIRKTLYKVRPDRQTVMTSATWPNGVRRLAISYMKNPAQIFVGSLDLTAVHSVEQIILVMEEDDKFDYFLDFIKTTDESQKIVVFTGKKAKASFLSSELSVAGIYCSSMHGDLEQCDREQAIEDMMNGTERILVATDIISRGIDIEDITHVVNYDFPRNIEDYVHRVGRTGRAGRTGVSITYFTWSDARHAEELIRILQEADQTVPPELESMNLRYKKRAASSRGSYRRY